MPINVMGDVHIGTYIETYINNADKPKSKKNTTDVVPAIDTSVLPAELTTDLAKQLLTTAQNAGWLDENYMPLLSKSKQALLAHEIAVMLDLDIIWKPFEILWQEKHLQQYYQKALQQTNTGDFLLIIRKEFQN